MSQAIHITEIELFTILKNKIGEKEAESVVIFVKQEVEGQLDRVKHTLVTSEDLKASIKSVRDEMREIRVEIRDLRVEFRNTLFWTVGLSTTLMGIATAILGVLIRLK